MFSWRYWRSSQNPASAFRGTIGSPEATLTPRLSAALIVHNEERYLEGCLASLRGLADEIVVLDDGSTDATVTIARAAGATVAYRPFDDFSRQKQAALTLATGDWVLVIDADERVTPALADAIRAVVAANGPADGYWVRRTITYLGAPLRHGGTGSEWIIRLVRRGRARFSERPIHEHLLVDGPTARLGGTLDHIKYSNLAEHLRTIDRYTDVIAEEKRGRGERFRSWHLFRPAAELVNRLVLRGGVLDGRPGIIYAVMASYYSFLKFAKMWRAGDR
jgi:glycosyltransferase involved in cell wall biosynthesis